MHVLNVIRIPCLSLFGLLIDRFKKKQKMQVSTGLYKDQLSLTNVRDVLHHGVRTANSAIYLQPNWVDNSSRRKSPILTTAPAFNLPHLHLSPLLGLPRVSFAKIFGIRKLRVPGLSCGVVCVILCLAISVEHHLVADRQTDRQTDTRRQANSSTS